MTLSDERGPERGRGAAIAAPPCLEGPLVWNGLSLPRATPPGSLDETGVAGEPVVPTFGPADRPPDADTCAVVY